MLMMSWFDDPHRSTRDLDLLGFGNPDPDPMLETFQEVLAQQADDGVTFDTDTLRVDRIREELKYGGLRLRVVASISGARINLTITSALAMRSSLGRRCWTILPCWSSRRLGSEPMRERRSLRRSSRRWPCWGVQIAG